MATDHTVNSRSRIVGPLVGVGGRAAASALRPLTSAVAGAVDRVLDSGEPERVVAAALDDARVQETVRHALASNGANRLIDSFFGSGLFDHFIDRLLASDALWRLVDEIAQSPSVKAAVSQQGLGFADQVGGEVRDRSRKADRRVEHSADRLTHRKSNGAPPDADARIP